ncbi:phytanoyl-CoA dioxygenase family protein [Microbulbifer sp. SSSA008]|uniref:phytanoyl-CoA dioxygenase family protein n=1 Tax=unclassified Microbulbifer TaxID=2619833 RepID=UPI004039F00D
MSDTLKKMFRGMSNLADTANFPISNIQHLKILAGVTTILLYRVFILPWQKTKKQKLLETLDQLKDLKINLPRKWSNAGGDDNFFLSDGDLSFFEQNGYLPPFQAIDKKGAEQLKVLALEEYDSDFQGTCYLGQHIPQIEKKHGRWSIDYAGLYQALRLKPFRELIRKPQISQRLASLLGHEVLCWRSQFFHKLPGTDETPWHQNATFREAGKYAKLQPTQETSPAIIQLNAWVALTDSTPENGCLRILAGSFTDARIDYLYNFTPNNKIFYLSLLPLSPVYLYHAVKVAFYGRTFNKSALVLFTALKLIGEDFFDQFEVKDIKMKAGECLIFSSLNMHASYPNSSKTQGRFSFVARCTANHVKVAPYGKDMYSTDEGLIEYDIPDVSTFQVYGNDTYGYNKILKE